MKIALQTIVLPLQPAGNSKKLLIDQSCEVIDSTHQLRYITHFVIVPANSFNQLLVANCQHFSLSSIKQRTECSSNNICAYNFIFCVTEAFVAGCFHSCIDLFDGNCFIQY